MLSLTIPCSKQKHTELLRKETYNEEAFRMYLFNSNFCIVGCVSIEYIYDWMLSVVRD
jgi:hypothetical protein